MAVYRWLKPLSFGFPLFLTVSDFLTASKGTGLFAISVLVA